MVDPLCDGDVDPLGDYTVGGANALARDALKARALQVLGDHQKRLLGVVVLAAVGGPAWEFFLFAYGVGHLHGELDERLHNLKVEANKRDAIGKHRVVTAEAAWEDPPPTVQRSSRRHGKSSVSSARNKR